ncbi:MAG: mannosyl-3-phosphoglycerate phosphatase [Paracoccaceae bacterium]
MTLEPTYQPKTGTRAVVFTDLDGTLLDHETYAWAAAIPALDALKARGCWCWRASKTAPRSRSARGARPGDAPAIVENGAGSWRPGAEAWEDGAYRRLRTALEALPKEPAGAFSRLRRHVGLRSGRDHGAVPRGGRPRPDPAVFRARDLVGRCRDPRTLSRRAGGAGDRARRGGRFLTLSLGATKADRMEEIAAALGATTTLALGDAPNDIEMLEAASAG